MFAHVDVDAFFASVLVRRDPRLRGKPLLALGMGGGCVIAASYEAKAKGVKTGMRFTDARKLCPGAIALPSDFEEALVASRQIISILEERCPFIETMSVDEWFLELRALPGGIPADPALWGKELQNEILRRTALTVSVGVGSSKLLAKMGSEYRKPAGVTVVDDRFPSAVSIDAFLRDRPAEAIPGIGRKRAVHCASNGWKTAWDIAHADPLSIQKLFGKTGLEMQGELSGIPIYDIAREEAPPQSVSRCRSFRATADRSAVFSHALDHLAYIVLKMRREELACRELSLWLRDAEYNHVGTHCKLPQPLDTEEQLLPYLKRAFGKLWEDRSNVTQVGVALMSLVPRGGAQYSLFEEPDRTDASEAAQQALDALHRRYGREAVFRGAAMRTHFAEKPHLNVWESGSGKSSCCNVSTKRSSQDLNGIG